MKVETSGEIVITTVLDMPSSTVTVLQDIGVMIVHMPGADREALEDVNSLLEKVIMPHGMDRDERLDFILQNSGPDLNIGFEDMDLLTFGCDDLSLEGLSQEDRLKKVQMLQGSILEAEYRADRVGFRLKQLRSELQHARDLLELLDG